LKLAAQLARRETHRFRDLRRVERLLDIFIHQRKCRAHCLAVTALRGRCGFGCGCGELVFGSRARARNQHLLRDFAAQGGASLARNQRQHHVDRRNPAAAGDSAAFSGIALGRRQDLRVPFPEALHVVPMHGGGMPVEQAGGGEYLTAGLDAADLDAEAGRAAQCAAQARILGVLFRVEAGEHQKRPDARVGAECAIDGDCRRIAGRHRQSVQGHRRPLEQAALRPPVCEEQRLNCGDQTEIGKIGQQQKSDLVVIRRRHSAIPS
jgi:hypothetical protein